ncbi:MAG TPA: catalase family protein [Candidatus Limnocylindrales bacterium]|nr:catalase family protein [Candidatus Limnocylindrales bacterium]
MKKILILALKWLGGIVLLLALAVIYLYNHDRGPSDAPMGEHVTANEDFLTAEIVRSAIDVSIQDRTKLIQNTAAHEPPPTTDKTAPGFRSHNYQRDVHTKGHGCVKATFKVDRVPPQFAFGVFAKPAEYDALVRFSSGNPGVFPDSEKDARGIAIKLFNVPGKKLLPGEEDDTTQDFLLMNNPIFFFRTIEEYAQFNQMLAYNDALHYFINPRVSPLRWHLRELKLLFDTKKKPPESLLTEPYWSASAYALGPSQYVHYKMVPCDRNKPMLDAKAKREYGYDFLRLDLAKQAATGGACFDFMVQPQVPGKNMPVEDTTVEWSESDSPFVKVASLELKPDPDMNTAERNTQCEGLSYNPWHSLVEHRPVGVMNRARKALYQEMGRFRRAKNCPEFCQDKCSAGNCAAGCVEGCVSACPLLNEPAGTELPAGACKAEPALKAKLQAK